LGFVLRPIKENFGPGEFNLKPSIATFPQFYCIDIGFGFLASAPFGSKGAEILLFDDKEIARLPKRGQTLEISK
jgi:hypothetical protein